jgi:hypothetical protein
MLDEQRPYLRLEKRAVVRSGRVDAGCDEEEKNANRATDRTRMKHGEECRAKHAKGAKEYVLR